MQSNPPQIAHTVNAKHSLCNPEPKLTQNKAVKPKEWKGVAPIPFLNPDPGGMRLVGRANEAPVVMDGCEMAALVD